MTREYYEEPLLMKSVIPSVNTLFLSFEEFNASIDFFKTTEIIEWKALTGLMIETKPNNACNFANLGGLNYPLPLGMNRESNVLIEFLEDYGDGYYKVLVTWEGQVKEGRASKYGSYPVFRVSFNP